MTLEEIEKATGRNKGTLHRELAKLEKQAGKVLRDPSTRKYSVVKWEKSNNLNN